jgi:hypothetical protein
MNILVSKFNNLVNLLLTAKSEVIISLPNITIEQANLLKEIRSKGIEVTLYIEIEENAYRSGFGDFETLEIIKTSDIQFFHKKNVNIYFYIIDEFGFFHFPKSRFTEDEGMAYDLFQMLPNQVYQLKALFKPNDCRDEIDKGILAGSDAEVIAEISGNISQPETKAVDDMVAGLKKDPPKKPLLQRTLLFYKGKFQVVEFEFKGANLHVKKIKIPTKALPFKDAELQKAMETNLRLFNQLNIQSFMKPFFEFKIEVDEIRKNYLVYLKSRNKSFISKDRLQAFEKEVGLLCKKAGNLEQTLINSLQDEISNTRDRITKNLIDFFRNNPPANLEGLKGETLNKELIISASKIVSKIKFPMAKEVLGKLKIEYSFYDITWETLNNKEMLSEMVEKGMISPEEKAHIESKGVEVEVEPKLPN